MKPVIDLIRWYFLEFLIRTSNPMSPYLGEYIQRQANIYHPIRRPWHRPHLH